jgi:hypothetical protein
MNGLREDPQETEAFPSPRSDDRRRPSMDLASPRGPLPALPDGLISLEAAA